jgi:predicted DCC family thiol-disulfide oxidoreductase YuxK
MRSPGPASVIYDGGCAFCRRWVARVHRCDRNGLLEMVPYQSLDLERRFPAVSREDCARRVHLVDARGAVYRGAAAVREALCRLPGGRLWTLPFRIPGGLRVADRVYTWVARRWGPLRRRVLVRTPGAA